jgi:hypothetical protein
LPLFVFGFNVRKENRKKMDKGRIEKRKKTFCVLRKKRITVLFYNEPSIPYVCKKKK